MSELRLLHSMTDRICPWHINRGTEGAAIGGRVSFAIRKTANNEKFSTGIIANTMPRVGKGAWHRIHILRQAPQLLTTKKPGGCCPQAKGFMRLRKSNTDYSADAALMARPENTRFSPNLSTGVSSISAPSSVGTSMVYRLSVTSEM